MKVEEFNTIGSWQDVKNSAMNTIGKDRGVPPKDTWRKNMLLAEHSPIRRLKYSWRWKNLKYWVSTHFVRHWNGIQHWVSTQRTDRTGVDRSNLSQSSLVSHGCECNAQSLINISRKRICFQASPETRQAWLAVKEEIKKTDPVMASVMVPECIYRGFCPEMKCCGYVNTSKYALELNNYRDVYKTN